MEEHVHTVKKSELIKYIKGHKNAHRLLKKQKRSSLQQLTVQQSLIEYESLCQLWEAAQNKNESGTRDKQRISFLIQRRKKIDKLASSLGKS